MYSSRNTSRSGDASWLPVSAAAAHAHGIVAPARRQAAMVRHTPDPRCTALEYPWGTIRSMRPETEPSAALPWRWSAIVFLVALLVQIPAWWQYGRDPYSRTLVSDALSYDQWATRIARDGLEPEPVFHQAPLYPVLLSGIHAALPVPLHHPAAIAVGIVLTALAAALVTWIAALYLGTPAAGVVAAGLILLHGPFAFYSLKLLPIPLSLATQAGGPLAPPPPPGGARGARAAPAGACLGIAALARSEVLLFAPFALLGVWPQDGPGGLRRAVPSLALALGPAAGIAPATLHNLRCGDLVLVASSGGENLYIGNRRG